MINQTKLYSTVCDKYILSLSHLGVVDSLTLLKHFKFSYPLYLDLLTRKTLNVSSYKLCEDQHFNSSRTITILLHDILQYVTNVHALI